MKISNPMFEAEYSLASSREDKKNIRAAERQRVFLNEPGSARALLQSSDSYNGEESDGEAMSSPSSSSRRLR